MKQKYVHLKKSCFFFIASWLKLSYLNIDIENIDPKEVEQKTLLQNKNLSTTTPSTCNRPLHANALREILLIFTERVTGLWPRLWPRRTSILTRQGNTRATLI